MQNHSKFGERSMHKRAGRRLSTILSAIFISVSAMSAVAQEWDVNSGTDSRGNDFAYMSIKLGGHLLSLSCDSRNKDDSNLQFKLFVPSLPTLFAEDGVEAPLSLKFVLPGGGQVTQIVDTYYFDGGPGDQAWLGKFSTDHASLNSIAAAKEILIMNPEGKTVLEFPATKTSLGVKKIRQMCQIGLI
jgi:hypothetical protein